MKGQLIKFNGITVDVEPFILYRGGNENDKLEAGWFFYPDETIDLKSFGFRGYEECDNQAHRIYIIPQDIHTCEDLRIIGEWDRQKPNVYELYCLNTHEIDQELKVEDMIVHAASKGATTPQLRTLSSIINRNGIENVSDLLVTKDHVHIYAPNNHIFIQPDGSSHT